MITRQLGTLTLHVRHSPDIDSDTEVQRLQAFEELQKL